MHVHASAELLELGACVHGATCLNVQVRWSVHGQCLVDELEVMSARSADGA
jgi:hypothetical protein